MIKVGFCVSYDWVLLKKSLPRVYDHADLICLSIDKERKSWSGKPYQFDEVAFKTWLAEIDRERKIDLYEDKFSLPELTPMQNDNRQRMLMGSRMGKGGWHVQIDSDEYFLSFELFVKTLNAIIPNPAGSEKPVNICPILIPLIKKTKNGYLFVNFQSQIPEYAPFATNVPYYTNARRNGHFNMLVPHCVIHETWARSDDELWYKMANWGHAGEEFASAERRISYFNLWKSLDEYNYQYLANFHPGKPSVWPALQFMQVDSVEDLLHEFVPLTIPLSKFQLWMRNNRNLQRIKYYSMKIWKAFQNRNPE